MEVSRPQFSFLLESERSSAHNQSVLSVIVLSVVTNVYFFCTCASFLPLPLSSWAVSLSLSLSLRFFSLADLPVKCVWRSTDNIYARHFMDGAKMAEQNVRRTISNATFEIECIEEERERSRNAPRCTVATESICDCNAFGTSLCTKISAATKRENEMRSILPLNLLSSITRLLFIQSIYGHLKLQTNNTIRCFCVICEYWFFACSTQTSKTVLSRK